VVIDDGGKQTPISKDALLLALLGNWPDDVKAKLLDDAVAAQKSIEKKAACATPEKPEDGDLVVLIKVKKILTPGQANDAERNALRNNALNN